MNTHELAYHLLAQPNMPVTMHVNNHSLSPHDPVRLTVATRYGVEYLVIGNLDGHRLNGSEWTNRMRVAL